MQIPPEHRSEFARFPQALQQLVLDELAAGNEIAELGHGYPAAPCGAYIKFAKPVSKSQCHSREDVKYFDRNSSLFAGEFSDQKRHFFVIEPPRPPPPEPDMDAIRAAMRPSASPVTTFQAPRSLISADTPEPTPPSLIDRFRASMTIDYDKWHDGIGYDVDLIRSANAEEKRAIEAMLLARAEEDWRDIEALAVLGTERAIEALRAASRSRDTRIRMAIHAYAPQLVSETQRVDSLVKALESGEFYGGLTQALAEVAELHPPEIIDALLRGLVHREGGVACHFAAMLYYLHGKASVPFDWAHRPFFLRFNTDSREAREQAILELCATLGIDPNRCHMPRRER